MSIPYQAWDTRDIVTHYFLVTFNQESLHLCLIYQITTPRIYHNSLLGPYRINEVTNTSERVSLKFIIISCKYHLHLYSHVSLSATDTNRTNKILRINFQGQPVDRKHFKFTYLEDMYTCSTWVKLYSFMIVL